MYAVPPPGTIPSSVAARVALDMTDTLRRIRARAALARCAPLRARMSITAAAVRVARAITTQPGAWAAEAVKMPQARMALAVAAAALLRQRR